MIGDAIQKAFNKQINAELYSAYLYLAMSAEMETQNFGGMAHWLRAQSQEEVEHAMKFYKFINERSGTVTLDKIDKPSGSWDTPLDAFEAAYQHETKVTAMIDDLVELARKEKDNASEMFLQWYVNEQVEEEASALQIVEQLKMVKGHPGGLFMLDHHLGSRGS
jgi:ferritin